MPLWNNVIKSQIDDLSLDILEQVISHIKACPLNISIQLGETTDVSNCSQLIALARYFHDGAIKENFIFCEELKTTTKAKDVFQFVKDFFAKHELDNQIICSVCTDGAPAILENKSVFFLHRGNSRFHIGIVSYVGMLWHQRPWLRNWKKKRSWYFSKDHQLDHRSCSESQPL